MGGYPLQVLDGTGQGQCCNEMGHGVGHGQGLGVEDRQGQGLWLGGGSVVYCGTVATHWGCRSVCSGRSNLQGGGPRGGDRVQGTGDRDRDKGQGTGDPARMVNAVPSTVRVRVNELKYVVV